MDVWVLQYSYDPLDSLRHLSGGWEFLTVAKYHREAEAIFRKNLHLEDIEMEEPHNGGNLYLGTGKQDWGDAPCTVSLMILKKVL